MSVDWAYWNQMPRASLRACVLLSIDRDPQQVEEYGIQQVLRDPDGWNIYQQRTEIALEHLVYRPDEPGLYSNQIVGDKLTFKIEIPQFITWAKHLKWSMPTAFAGYTPPVKPVAITQILSPPESPIGDRERDSLHRIVGAMLAYIKGERGSRQHRDYKSEAELIRTLVDKNDGNEGVSERNLQKVFSLSKQLLK